MSCCWRPVAQQQAVRGDRRTPTGGANGIIPLNDHPDGSAGYRLENAGQTIYIVGWRTEHERLFLAADSKRAVAYRNEIDRTLALDLVQANQLPRDAVVELLAAR